MTLLAILLGLCCVLNLAVAYLLLALPLDTLRRATGWHFDVMPVRLLGVTLIALLVGYGFALMDAMGGWISTGPLLMGLVAKGGAASYLIASDRGTLRGLGMVAGALALALAICFISPEIALFGL